MQARRMGVRWQILQRRPKGHLRSEHLASAPDGERWSLPVPSEPWQRLRWDAIPRKRPSFSHAGLQSVFVTAIESKDCTSHLDDSIEWVLERARLQQRASSSTRSDLSRPPFH